jgi:hypothetical protein
MRTVGMRASARPLVLVEAGGPRATHHKTILVTVVGPPKSRLYSIFDLPSLSWPTSLSNRRRSYGMDQQEAYDKHHRGGHAMN